MSLLGRRLGPFEIVTLLGKGGMGEVYRAHDARLRRDVAIKALPAELALEPDRLARLRREARMLAALTHPNVAVLYGLEESDDGTFLVMELVEGETLDERLARTGPLAWNEALTVATQIADALGAAHAKGIVHRDVKPTNIKLTPDGRVKVLDFGLAKSHGRGGPTDETVLRPTLSGLETQPGMIIGTPTYMSPEQVRGQASDHRSDVWAIGCVLYELCTGARAFSGATLPDTLAAVLQCEPEWRALPATAPGGLQAFLARCLAKDPAWRWQSVPDLHEALTQIGPGRGSTPGRGRMDGLVVLPLRNLSGDPAQDYFADGMTEALIWDLAKLRALRVISRTSAMVYKNTSLPLPEIARALHVDGVMEGSVVRDGQRVHIRAQLIDASTDTTVWGGSYERDLKDILILQSEIARTIAREIQVVVTPEEIRHLAEGARTVDPVAYEAYLKGQFHWGKLTPSDLDAALGYFERARGREAALGDVGIAAVWVARQQMNLAPPSVSGPRAKAAIQRALDAGDHLPEVHYVNALVKCAIDWDWDAAHAEFARTFQLRPGFAEAHAYYSHLLIMMDRPQEAIREMQHALDLDPHNALFRCLYGIVLVIAREFDRAISEFREVQLVVPANAVISRGLHMALHLTGRREEARAEQRAWFTTLRDTEAMAALDAGTDYADAMLRAAETLAARGRTGYYSPCDISRLYLTAGRKTEAMDWLEIALAQRDPDMPYVRNVLNEPLFEEPRFQGIVRQMRFP